MLFTEIKITLNAVFKYVDTQNVKILSFTLVHSVPGSEGHPQECLVIREDT